MNARCAGQAREDLILGLADIVRHQANLLTGGRWALLDDLISEGWVGACRAVDSFRADSGASLRTYATIRIRGAQLDWLRTNQTVSGLARARIAQDDVRRHRTVEVPEALPADDDPATAACNRVDVVRALRTMPRRTQEVVLERVVLETPLEVLGTRYGVTGTRICQIMRGARVA